jgi:hypothetical protein
MRRDNIFPLLDVKYRSIQTTVADPIDKGHWTEDHPTPWEVKPGLICPKKVYDFFREHKLVEQPVFAHARGMANAVFRWTIEGVELPIHENWANVTINSSLAVKNPDGTITHVANAVTFQYGILDVWNGSVLYLKTLNWNGNCELKVTVAAKEAAVNEAEVTAEESVGLTTVSWIQGEAIKKAWKRCNPFYARMNDTFWYLTEQLIDHKNRPDPPSERSVREIVYAVEQLQKAVALYTKAGHQTEAEVWRQLGTPNGLQSIDPVPDPVNMSRLRLRDDVGQEQASQDNRKEGQESEA